MKVVVDISDKFMDNLKNGFYEGDIVAGRIALSAIKNGSVFSDVTPCEDAVNRRAVLDLIEADWKYEGLEVSVANLPSVQPKLPECEDAISRQAVMDTISNANCGFDRNFELDYGMCYKAELEDAIENLPPVQPKPKTGKWLLVHPLQEDDEGGYMCSECGTGYYYNSHWNFCPFCGTKMEV